jgi:hypothetical protein
MTNESGGGTKGALPARLRVGLAQGVALYLLSHERLLEPQFGVAQEVWAPLISTLRLVAVFAPLPILFGIGNLPLKKLAPWSLVAAAALFAFGWFASAPAWQGAPTANWLFSLIVIYILHEFIQAAHDDGRPIASYETYFERAWRHGFQGALALGFTAAFWIVISLGAWLFGLIGLVAIRDAIFSDEFRFIASAIAFALGVHLTDADAGLTRGARQIGLTLLSWLAILMTLILSAFLVALPFTGLEPLWDTKRATVLLLNAAATMILLVNAAYQAGDPPKSAVMRGVVRFSALPLAGVVALAALGLTMRVDQYGFTPARVLAGAELVIVAFYAVGYVFAAVAPGPWLAQIRNVNIAGALVVAALLSALMTPILDPARVAVADQIARLDRGAIEPDDFDFGFLADSRSGAHGKKALERLAARSGSERDDRIALLAKNPASPDYFSQGDQSFNDRRAALVLLDEGVIPDEALLATSFFDPVSECVSSMKAFEEGERLEAEQARQRERLGRRLTTPANPPDPNAVTPPKDPDGGKCPARLVDADFDGDQDLIILGNPQWGGNAPLNVHVILSGAEGWRYAGGVNGYGGSVSVDPAGVAGQSLTRAKRREMFESAGIVPHPYKDVIISGARLRVDAAVQQATADAAMLIDSVSDLPVPASLMSSRAAFDLNSHCLDYIEGLVGDNSCVARSLDLNNDGTDEYALFSVQRSGYVSLAAFDSVSGELVARGAASGRSGMGTDLAAAGDEARLKRAEERRSRVRAASLAAPILGDLMIDGRRVSFAYADWPLEAATAAAR